MTLSHPGVPSPESAGDKEPVWSLQVVIVALSSLRCVDSWLASD